MARGQGKTGAGGAAGADDAQITLGVLSAIEAQSDISQRTLSSELGVALGLANAYLKRCVKKGYVKISAVPRRRYVYFLTPQGFAEKARLTGEYLSSSLQFFRRARQQIGEQMAQCAARGHRRIALAGASELAEIATLTAHDHEVTILGVVDASLAVDRFCGLRVVRRLGELGAVDAVILTGTERVDDVARVLADELGADRIFAPELVHVSQIRKPRRKVAGRASASGYAPAEPGE